MSTIIPRENTHNIYLGKREVIRLRSDEFVFLQSMSKLTHFNLQISEHIVGKIYSFPKIVKHGYFTEDGKEVLPELDYTNCKKGLCVSVRENVPYSEITPEDFTHSFPHIQSVEELQHTILHRYLESMPDLSKEKICAMGVSITNLDILS